SDLRLRRGHPLRCRRRRRRRLGGRWRRRRGQRGGPALRRGGALRHREPARVDFRRAAQAEDRLQPRRAHDRGHGNGRGRHPDEHQRLARRDRAGADPRLIARTPMTLLRLLMLAVGLAVLPVQADNASAAKRLSELLSQSQTLTGKFSQLTLDASGTNLQESTGEMFLKRPGQFRWHTDPPLEQLLVSDGKQVWLYDPDLEQVTIQQLDQRLTHTPALLLSGDVS